MILHDNRGKGLIIQHGVSLVNSLDVEPLVLLIYRKKKHGVGVLAFIVFFNLVFLSR